LFTFTGELDIELWCNEAPRACRNFIQLCLEGYYDETIFHRLVPGFMIQGGDPTGTGKGKIRVEKISKIPEVVNQFMESHFLMNFIKDSSLSIVEWLQW